MSRLMFAVALGAMLTIASAAAQADEKATDGKEAKAIDYQGAAAHAPQFDRDGLWPADVKKTAYSAQKWPAARLLVWAKKGDFSGDVNAPANWLDGGKPATKGPDENTDVIFPDQAENCELVVDGVLKVRHLTIGNNVLLKFSVNPGLHLKGNVWVRERGRLDVRSPHFIGEGHSFARNDNTSPNGRAMGKMPQFSKIKDASVELLGNWGNRDGLNVNSGKMILGPGASFWGGNRHPNTVAPKASFIMMSGSSFQTWKVRKRHTDLDIYGTFQAGTKERPLTKDAVFYLCSSEDRRYHGRSFIIRPSGSIAVHSADPQKARLVFRIHPEQESQRDSDSVKTEILLLGKTDLNGVLFDDVAKGGIVLEDLKAREGWKNVFYGKHNEGTPDELYKKAEGADEE